jgi:hypothetical protein
MNEPYQQWPGEPGPAARIAGRVMLALLGLVVGAIVGVVIALFSGWLGPLRFC